MIRTSEASIRRVLGEPLETHRYNLFNLGSCASLAGFIFGPLSLLVAISAFNVADIGDRIGDLFFFLCIGLPWFVFAILAALNAYNRRRDRVVLHENGFQYHFSKGESAYEGYRTWDQITYVLHVAEVAYRRRGHPIGTNHTYTVGAQGESVVVLDDELRGVHDLGRTIQEQVKEPLVQSGLQDLENREMVVFGPIVLTEGKLSLEGETIALNELESIFLEPQIDPQSGLELKVEDVVFRKTGMEDEWGRVPVSEVPNEFVLINLAERLGVPQVKRPPASYWP